MTRTISVGQIGFLDTKSLYTLSRHYGPFWEFSTVFPNYSQHNLQFSLGFWSDVRQYFRIDQDLNKSNFAFIYSEYKTINNINRPFGPYQLDTSSGHGRNIHNRSSSKAAIFKSSISLGFAKYDIGAWSSRRSMARPRHIINSIFKPFFR